MRPPGEIRLALVTALQAGPGVSREVAQRARTGYEATRRTLDNMVRAGVAAKRKEPARVPGCKRPVPVYELAEASATPDSATVLAGWPARS